MVPSTEPTISEVLESHLRQRLGGRIRNLRIESNNRHSVIYGHVNTYYALQLTIAATNTLPQDLDDALLGDLELAIRVSDSASDFRSVCGKHGNGDT
jgi:hypothetical protein